jgi:hypothetical protein
LKALIEGHSSLHILHFNQHTYVIKKKNKRNDLKPLSKSAFYKTTKYRLYPYSGLSDLPSPGYDTAQTRRVADSAPEINL